MKKLVASIAVAAALAGTSVQATPIRLDGAETNLQQTVNNLTIGGPSSINVADHQYAYDESWMITSLFGAQGRIVMELAGYAGANSFGIYDLYNPNSRVQLFSGAASAGATTSFDIGFDGRVYRNDMDTGVMFARNLFGFYLDTPEGLWFSESDRNADNADHMVAYQGVGDPINTPMGPRIWGSDMFLLAWEDLSAGHWDQDYNDMALFVRGISVPEPTTLGLMGLGLAAFGFFGRRKIKA